LLKSGIEYGPLFRSIDRHSKVSEERLSGETVLLIVREQLAAAGIDPSGYSGLRLRAGLATIAAQAGISSWKIHQQTGHASDVILACYIGDGELFMDNAAGAFL
jgi:integrase